MLLLKYSKAKKSLEEFNDFYKPPKEYPDIGIYHPRMRGKISNQLSKLPRVVPEKKKKGTVGLIVLRSYLLAGNTGHYDGVIAAFESLDIQVIPCFSMGLDARPAIEKFLIRRRKKD